MIKSYRQLILLNSELIILNKKMTPTSFLYNLNLHRAIPVRALAVYTQVILGSL